MDRNKEEQVSLRAYQIWEDEGRPAGRHDHHWRRAERDVYGDDIAVLSPGLDGSGGDQDMIRLTETSPLDVGQAQRARIREDDIA